MDGKCLKYSKAKNNNQSKIGEMKRRKFVRTGSQALLSAGLLSMTGCSDKSTFTAASSSTAPTSKGTMRKFNLSLAQWSLHRHYAEGIMSPMNFAQQTRSFDLMGMEYVSGLYSAEREGASSVLAGMKSLGSQLLQSSKDEGIENILIMVDGEGDLAVPDADDRRRAAENHQKWVDMAKYLGCHSIRVNVFGTGTRAEMHDYAVDGLAQLASYGAESGIHIIVENHGGYSSDPDWMCGVIKAVDNQYCGLLPDFGNWCVKREGGERWSAPCIEETDDMYRAVTMMMPFAQGVSAKSYNFDSEGNETKIDYKQMLEIVSASDYDGPIGIEYEGADPEDDGIRATRDLLLRHMTT